MRFDRAHLAELANASLDFELVLFSLDPDANIGMDLQQAIYLAILRRFEVERISLAYPTRVIIQRSESPEAIPPVAGNVSRDDNSGAGYGEARYPVPNSTALNGHLRETVCRLSHPLTSLTL